ncbi:hypothetical protein GWK47_014622 [Chionoecetes opilio]|uniref:Uncharacterized protein n=1 Tax=Chionoecetes opilio TaxID=41210 RepID=A0A8J4XY27_CHIOP|nr:hypothetical protein GWK47_014622 [Chionoecetes opilio]
MRAMTRLTPCHLLCPPPVLHTVQLCASWWIYTAPLSHRAFPPASRSASEWLQQRHGTMLMGRRWPSDGRSACVMQSETRLVPLATMVQMAHDLSRGQSLPPHGQGVAQRGLRLP